MLRDNDQKNYRQSISISRVFFFLFLFVTNFYSISSIAETRKVVRVIDGDTVILLGGKRVRLLGINAPEVASHKERAEPGAVGAKKFLEKTLLNKRIYLERDEEKHDKYGRILAYLFSLNGENINQLLVEEGFAFVSLHPPNLKYSRLLLDSQKRAEKKKVGLWKLEAYRVLPIELIATRTKKWGRFSAGIKKIERTKRGYKLWLKKNIYLWAASVSLNDPLVSVMYQTKKLEVRGWPKKWGKNWSIQIYHPSQIKLLNLE